MAAQLATDYLHPKLLQLFKEQPRKIFAAARVIYAFIPERVEDRLKVLRALDASLGEDEIGRRTWMSVLAALAPYDSSLMQAEGGQLLRTYLEYVDQGMSDAYPARVRAAALSILAPMAANTLLGADVVESIMQRVQSLIPQDAQFKQQEEKSDSSQQPQREHATGRGLAGREWLIDAELLHVLSCSLSHPATVSNPSLLQSIHEWIGILLGSPSTTPLPTLKAGLAHLTHVLGSQPPLRRVWMAALTENDDVRTQLLHSQVQQDDSTSSSMSSTQRDLESLHCPRLRSIWHPLTIAQTLADVIRVTRMDNLTAGQVDLLSCAVEDAFAGGERGEEQQQPSAPLPLFADSESEEWCRVILALRDHLVVELCDANLSDTVITMLRRFLYEPRTSAAAQTILLPNQEAGSAGDAENTDGGDGSTTSTAPPPLYCILRFLYPDGAEEAQLNLAGFLEELCSVPGLAPLVHQNVSIFAENETEKFQDSPLVHLLEKLNQHAMAQQHHQGGSQ